MEIKYNDWLDTIDEEGIYIMVEVFGPSGKITRDSIDGAFIHLNKDQLCLSAMEAMQDIPLMTSKSPSIKFEDMMVTCAIQRAYHARC
ncbi:MAG: hypothetical protein AABY32_01990 [Nanoarchaeota archaeon]